MSESEKSLEKTGTYVLTNASVCISRHERSCETTHTYNLILRTTYSIETTQAI